MIQLHVPSVITTARSGRPSRILVLAVLCVAQLMVALDGTIVTVALPSIRAELMLSPSDMQWVVNGYTLSLAGLLLLGGRLGDVFGRKRVFLIGLAVFTVASLAGGLSPSGPLLIAARIAQGVGAAILTPATLSLLTAEFPELNQRRKALGVWTAVASAGAAVGGLLGGVLTDLLSWHWILLVNIPVGVALLAVAGRTVRESPGVGGTVRSLDLPGALAVSLGLAALVYAVVVTDTSSWGSPRNLIALITGGVLMVLFGLIELRSTHPLLPLGLFRIRAVVCANGLSLLLGGGLTAMFYFLSLYMQTILGLSPLQAGLAFVPGSLAMVAGTIVATRLLPVYGARGLLVVAGLLSFGGVFWLSRIPIDGSFVHNVLGQVLIACFGVGMVFVPITIAAVDGVATVNVGVASGLLNTSKQVGSTVGLAALATAATRRTSELTQARGTTHMQLAATAGGYQLALLLAAVLVLAAVVVSFAVPRVTVPAATLATPAPPAVPTPQRLPSV